MIFRSNVPDIVIPQLDVFSYITSNPEGISDTKDVFIDGNSGHRITYGELKQDAKRFAAGLQDKFGFKRGDVLAVYSPNQVDYPIVAFGTIVAGGAITPVNPLQAVKDVEHQLRVSKARVLVVHPTCLENATKAANAVGISRRHLLLFGDKEIDNMKPYSDLLGVRVADPVVLTPEEARTTTAFLCFSSGTTGAPKGVETTHFNMVANVAQYIASKNRYLPPGLVFMGSLPFFHIYGLNMLLHLAIVKGGSVVVMAKPDLTLFCKLIQEYKINVAYVVPPQVLGLIKSPEVKTFDLSSLRFVVSGAAPLSKSLSEEFTKTLNIPITQGFGMTETSPVTHVAPHEDTKDGSIGRLLPNIEAKILSVETGKELGYNEWGEMCVRGPNIMKGYLNNPEATAAIFDADGFLHTGDLASVDEDGFFFIHDRLKNLIKYKGFQVPPAELEATLLSHPDVKDAAVIGVWDESQQTELPAAYVVPQPGREQTDDFKRELQQHVADNVAKYKKLYGGIVFTDVIPKSPAGKILHKDLKARVADDFPALAGQRKQ